MYEDVCNLNIVYIFNNTSIFFKKKKISDLPIPYLIPELMLYRPNHVVILTTRTESSWMRSFRFSYFFNQ